MQAASFETDRLICRPTSLADAGFIYELLNTKQWLANIGDRKVHNTEDAAAYITNRMLPQLARLGYGNYTVIRKEDGLKIGTVGLYDREGLDGIDIGFAFLPAYHGKGYALESNLKLMEVAQNAFHIKTINAITLPTNKPSQNLLERIGLSFIKPIQLPGDDEELLFYSTKTDTDHTL